MLKRKLISSVLAFGMLLIPANSLSQPSFADSSSKAIENKYESRVLGNIRETERYLESLSIDELNEYIDYIAYSENKPTSLRSDSSVRAGSSLNALRNAWLAAAAIAKKTGYPLSAKLVKYSVYNNDYSEKNGMFAKEIKRSSEYKNWLKDHDENYMEFVSGDLFYALHYVKMSVVSMSSQGSEFHVEDTFDFKYQDYNSIFTDTVNNWAWLCQNVHVLNEVEVDIYINN